MDYSRAEAPNKYPVALRIKTKHKKMSAENEK
jgi:hypothetical protein